MRNFSKTFVGVVAGILLTITVGVLAQTSARQAGEQVQQFNITNYPHYGAAATQSDSANFNTPRTLRANANGAVRVSCWANPVADYITLTVVAGEFIPCQVRRLWDTGTDAITIHQFY